MKKILKLLGVSVVCFLMACTAGQNINNSEDKFPVISPIILDTAYTQDYIADIQAIQNVEIRARVKGFLDKIFVDEGKIVREGQSLFFISNQEYKEELLKAKALLKNVIAEAKASEFEVKNNKILVDKKVISQTELEMAQAKWDALLAKVDEARSNESNASLNLSYTTIKAPFNGVINRIPNKEGSLIEEGTLLTTISNDKEMYAYFHVSEQEYLSFLKQKVGQPEKEVSLLLADGQPYLYKGMIETVESEIDKNTGNLAFRARFKNPERLLKHGASAKIQLINQLTKATVIPQKATFEIQEKVYVFVVGKDNVVRNKNIVIKKRLPHLFVLESGLSPDDKIIYEGIQNLTEGEKIIPEEIPMRKIMSQLAAL